ncbi:MAG TPA: amidohydrolase family protein, partial [Candidatus Limnocylindrales bacterium]|nr:amidohydrolase family protein [Candidatus Limnocylindrales bacterium]
DVLIHERTPFMKKAADSGRGAVYIASRIFLGSGAVQSPGAVAVSDGVLVAAGTPRDVERTAPSGLVRREFPGAVLLPGLVNAHTHLQIPRLKVPEGAASSEAFPFVHWILRIIAWKRGAPPEEYRKNFDAAAAEALASGTTALGEIAGPDSGVYEFCPLRARVFAEGIGFHPEAAVEALTVVESALERLEAFAGRAGGLIFPGVSPHTLYTVGPELLRSLGDLAVQRGIPACLHLAESPAEMEFLRTGGGEVASRLYPAVGKDVSWFRGIGMPIREYLEQAGLLREWLLLVHNVHLTRKEIGELRKRGARFVLCPRSNAAHGNGQPDVAHFVDTGIPFALGTDSLGSVPDLSVWEEMRAARSLYRGNLTEAELCRVLFRAATEYGAASLGLPGGSLRAGRAADFIVADDPGGDANAAIRNLVDRTGGKNIRLTVVGGTPRHERL